MFAHPRLEGIKVSAIMLGPKIWLWMRRALNIHVRYQVHISMAHEILPKYFNAVIYSWCKQSLVLV